MIILCSRIIKSRYVDFPSTLSNITFKCYILFYGIYVFESFQIFCYEQNLQMEPQSYPEEMKKSLVKGKALPIPRRKGCPYGTVPIQRTTKDDLLKARNFSNEFTKSIGNIAAKESPSHVNKPHLSLSLSPSLSIYIYLCACDYVHAHACTCKW